LIGQTLLHYRITAALGAGGMGEVYRATDTKLGRAVAIKVLPPDVTEDPERLGRFQREAHLLAALNHPNVAAIYGLEEVDDQPFLVLELVEGEDLAARLKRGAIPVDETLEIARQIAEGLEAAHEEGIVHRDLKPANVKLTPDGRVKVLDFGLAKAWAGDLVTGSSGDVSQSPTLAHTGTRAGVILGTAAYMSPEQARGRAVDKRADVWSFGVLLWEMLTGRSLFAGDTVTDVIAAVMTHEPDLGALPAATPRAVRQLVARCLRRDPRTRLPDIGAARLELAETMAGTTYGAGVHEPDGADLATEGRHGERWAWAAAFLVAAGFAVVVAFLHFTEAPDARPVEHFVLDTPEGVSLGLSRGFITLPAVSPDGRHVTFVGRPRNGPPRRGVGDAGARDSRGEVARGLVAPRGHRALRFGRRLLGAVTRR
jgi:serine/threonine-protein kinase